MNSEMIKETLKKILADYDIISSEHYDLDNLDYDADVEVKYSLDSIKIIQLIVAMETEFDIEFEDSQLDLENFKTLNNILEVLNTRLI